MDWFDPTGHPWAAIGCCDRCHRAFLLDELIEDGNLPGLRVCREDWDQLDPYRLPARQPDNLVLPFVRPDVPISLQPTVEEVTARITEEEAQRLTQQDEERITQ